MSLLLTRLESIPLINPRDNLPEIITKSLEKTDINLENGDILVFAQKIISKAEERLVNLTTVHPSEPALKLAAETGKDPRLVEVILRESKLVMRTQPGLIIVEHRLGFVCANAGIDHSNVQGEWGNQEDWYLLLPLDPDNSALELRTYFKDKYNVDIGVMIIDSHGRAWRNGTVGMCIGLSGFPGIVNLCGRKDLFNYELKATVVGVADELASAASLMMGQASEGTPVIHVRGFPYPFREANLSELIRPEERDLFR